MELKKSEKANLDNKKLLFFEIGLIFTLLAVYVVFEIKTKAEEETKQQEEIADFIEIEDVPITMETTPPPPPPKAPPKMSFDEINIVDNEDAVEEDLFVDLEEDGSPIEIMDYVETQEEEVEEEAIPFALVEEKPSFMGGDANQFSKWVNQRLVYPEVAKENGVQGRVTLQFTVEKDGSVTKVKVLRGVAPELDKEAVRVVSSSPKWKPGKQRDRAVAVTYTFPVIFQLR